MRPWILICQWRGHQVVRLMIHKEKNAKINRIIDKKISIMNHNYNIVNRHRVIAQLMIRQRSFSIKRF